MECSKSVEITRTSSFESQVTTSGSSNSLEPWPVFYQRNVRNAEILWTLKLVLIKWSLRYSEQLKVAFQVMFSDSKIAKVFQLGKTKCDYNITCGITPCFKDPVTRILKHSPCFSAFLDESKMLVFWKEQIDMNIRYWDEKLGITQINYFAPQFFE